MLKKHKTSLIVTSLVILIPILVGLLLWDKLPEQVPFHWGIDGQVDNWADKPTAVFLIPLMLLAMHWVCMLVSSADPKNKNYHPKAFTLVLWICPMLNLMISSIMYATALGYAVNVEVMMPLFMGALFIIIGNLLPKMRQSTTMGIKLPWTLHSEENWNKTHRVSGKLWVAGGIVILATAFLGSFWILIAVLLVMVIIPTLYSYLLYHMQRKNDEGEKI